MKEKYLLGVSNFRIKIITSFFNIKEINIIYIIFNLISNKIFSYIIYNFISKNKKFEHFLFFFKNIIFFQKMKKYFILI